MWSPLGRCGEGPARAEWGHCLARGVGIAGAPVAGPTVAGLERCAVSTGRVRHPSSTMSLQATSGVGASLSAAVRWGRLLTEDL